MPLAGQTLIEYQVRVARAAGVGHIVLLVDQIPGALVAAFDRLRDDGISIDIARDVRDAADRIHPDEELLVFSEGVIGDLPLLKALAMAGKPTLLTVPGEFAPAGLERIDASDFWAGIGLLNGKLLRETVAMLGDWALAPTLLRAALANGVARMPAPENAILGKIGSADDAGALTRRLASQPESGDAGPVSTYIFARLSALVAPELLTRHVPLDLVAVLPLVLFGGALVLAFAGWPATGLCLALCGGFLGVIGNGMSRAGLRELKVLGLFEKALSSGAITIFLVIGWQQVVGGQGWGAGVLAVWTATALALAPKPRPAVAELFLALLVMVLAHVAGVPLIGFAAIIALVTGHQALMRWRAR